MKNYRNVQFFGWIVFTFLLLSCAARGAQNQGTAVPRAEHPRPDFMRADWRTLNGAWEFEFDDADRGLSERWYGAEGARRFTRQIIVPYAFQTKLSGIGDASFHDIVWYRRKIQLPENFRQPQRRVLLKFGAVDYESIVWVNGERVGSHRGGHVGFGFDVTDHLRAGDNTVVVRVWDPGTDRTIPRGKQFWEPRSEGIFYTRTTGIWQPVWIEATDSAHIESVRITSDVDAAQVSVQPTLSRLVPNARLRTTVRFGESVEAQHEITCTVDRPVAVVKLSNQRLWSPERPQLYDLTIELVGDNNRVLDRVESYFGQRKVAVHGDRIFLNNEPYYLKMVLDQGYWPESTITPPSDEAIQYDIKMTKAFGFNGARKHQKVEDPRWLYWADRMGLIVWGEMANAHQYSPEYAARFVEEWQAAIERDYNHPSIIAWVPINESWGVPQIATDAAQQAHMKMLYFITHSLDRTRLVSDNDGWEHTDATDIFGIHDYARTGAEFAARYRQLETERTTIPRNGREALAFGFRYNNSPLVLTEFGGISYRVGAQKADNEWGYSGIEPTKEALLSRLDGLVAVVANKLSVTATRS
ncbi:MAG: sugar-binding domain-containing protein [Pyrinomonadaceae bacterium]